MFKWALLIGVLGAIIAVPYLYQQLDEQIRRRVEAKFAEHYRGLKVTVRSAELVKGKGIEIRGLSIVEPGAQGPQAELFHVEEVRLSCQTDLEELLTHDPVVTQVLLRRPTLRVTRRPDGTWNAAKLLPLPQLSLRAPAVAVEGGSVEIFDPLKTPAGTFTVRDINLNIAPPDPKAVGELAEMRRVRGTLGADLLRQVQLDGWIDPHGQVFDVGGAIESLELSPELRNALPGVWGEKLAPLGTFRGQLDLTFRMSYQPAAQVPLQFQAGGRLIRGRLDDPRLPRPVTDMQANIQVSHEGFVIQNLTARSGQADLLFSCKHLGFQQNGPLWLQAKVQRLDLDNQLMDVLNETFRRQWRKYLPAGPINANLTLEFDGRTWKPELSVHCLDVSFAYEKFPYRLEHGRGMVQLKDDVLTANLTAYAGSQPVHILAEARSPTTAPYGWTKIDGENLQLDERLFRALPEKSRDVVHGLAPQGTIDFAGYFVRHAPNEPVHRDVSIRLNHCSMRYTKFPYPLSNIGGLIQLRDNVWTFSDLQGSNGTGVVTCRGDMKPTPQGNLLSLTFTAKNISLEGELRDALRQNLQDLWDCLRPQGTVDLPEVQATYLSGQEKPNVSFRAEPRENTSINPVAFPYRLEELQGGITYRDGRASWKRARAKHGDTEVLTDGECELTAAGGWRLRLFGLSVDRLRTGRDLIQAMPERLKRGILGLNPSGACSLRGMFELARAGGPRAPLASQWDLEVTFQQAAVDFGLRLENLCGSARFWGRHEGEVFGSHGELNLDSLTYRNLQFTWLQGPLWIDNSQILFGQWVEPVAAPGSGDSAASPQRRPLKAALFGGTMLGNARIALGDIAQYEVHTELYQADLSQAAQELVPGQQRLRGKIRASADLHGTGRNLANLSGTGKLALRDANVYELPVMIAMLKLLRVQTPDTNAFSSSDMSFRIEGPHIYLDPITFSGDAISLSGNGEVDLQTNLQLAFSAQLGPTEERIPLISGLLGGASEQILQIRVKGTLQDPVVTKEAFPGVNKALQQLQEDLQPDWGSAPQQAPVYGRFSGRPTE